MLEMITTRERRDLTRVQLGVLGHSGLTALLVLPLKRAVSRQAAARAFLFLTACNGDVARRSASEVASAGKRRVLSRALDGKSGKQSCVIY
jgi:hypothetical protein